MCAMPHMHPHEPARAHFVGHLSPEWDPQRYVSAVTDLARWHAAHHGAAPLIVNTCGWIKVGPGTSDACPLYRLSAADAQQCRAHEAGAVPLASTFSSACTAWATLCQRMKEVVVESLFILYASHAEY